MNSALARPTLVPVGRLMPEARNNQNSHSKLGRQVMRDLKRGDLGRALKRDLSDLYNFYLTDEDRLELSKMGRLKRSLVLVWWLLKGLILKLPPLRRLLLLLALLCFVEGGMQFKFGEHFSLDMNLTPASVVLLLIVLMLELKDKLLAKDELELGRRVQMALMPEACPEIPGWDVWFFTRPANDVGGDLVDCIQLAEGRWGLALGDVSGKGLGAALLMAKLQSTLRAIATDEEGLAAFGARLNRILCRDGLPGKFATLAFLEASAGSGRVRLLNAGHLPPLLVKAGKTESLKPVAPPLGIFPDAVYQEQSIDVEPGEMLIVYSDGVTEAHDARWEFYGDERLVGMLPAAGALTAKEAGELIVNSVDNFVGDERAFDDLSLIVLKRACTNQ